MSDAAALAPFVEMALGCVDQAYPNQIAHRMAGDEDARPPRALTPAFYGCYDWHSAVHGHWLLARAIRFAPQYADAARARLAAHLTEAKLAAERAYLEPRAGFERPYGIAWLLTLHLELAELQGAGDPAGALAETLAPLAELCASRFDGWLPKLRWPTRSGTHAQTAFSLGLALDWAAANDPARRARWSALAEQLHGGDRDLPLHLEPAGEDFLSASLAAADLMRRVREAGDFAAWFDRALPDFAPPDPVEVVDAADGRLAHLDGLNLSRAWMLERVGAALSQAGHPGAEQALASAAVHREAGLRGTLANAETHYAGSHWLGTFAMVLLTARGA